MNGEPTTIGCKKETKEKYNKIRGNDFKNSDTFLNELLDKYDADKTRC